MSLLTLLQGAPAPPPTAPPVGLEVVYLKRVSPVYEEPTLGAFGRPVGWAPLSETIEDWGRLQVIVGGVDVTFLRDVPCEVVSWSTVEPFGDETAVIKFPQISPFDELGAGDLAPFVDGADVTINRIWFDGAQNQEAAEGLWFGFWVTDNVEHDETTGGTTVDCLGVLYEADLRLAKPSLDPGSLTDVAGLIWEALSGWLSGDQFRFAPPVIPSGYPNPGDFGTGVFSTDQGAYQPILTGLVQDYLAMAFDPYTGVQWTVTNDEREADIVLKDVDTSHWQITTGTPGLKLALTRDITMTPNALYGSGFSPQDNCEWRNARYPGLTTGNVFVGLRYGAYIAPLDVQDEVEPYLYDSEGAIAGDNPDYDPAVLRVERYENFGRVDKIEAGGSAQRELSREAVVGYAGTLTLKIDPWTGSRWAIRAGQNISLLALRGQERKFHIARAVASPAQGTMTLTVDEKARDMPTLAAFLNRRRDNTDLVRRDRPTRNTSRLVIDRTIPWDCMPGDTLVYAEHGPRPLRQVAVGDLVWSYVDGQVALCAVERAESKGVQPTFDVRTGGRSIRVSEGHRFLVAPRLRDYNGRNFPSAPSWKSVRELVEGDRLVQLSDLPDGSDGPIDLLPSVPFEEDLAWLVGVAIGDGHVRKAGGRVEMCVYGDLRDDVLDVAKRLFGVRASLMDERHGVFFEASRDFTAAMVAGGVDAYSADRVVPDVVWRSPRVIQRAFLAGYQRADGYWNGNKGCYSYAAAAEQLLRQIRALHIQHGDQVSNMFEEVRPEGMTIKGVPVRNTKSLWRFSCNSHGRGFYSHDGEPFAQQVIRSVQPAATEELFDIQVAGSRNFIAEGVVVHNCESGAGIVASTAVPTQGWAVVRIPVGTRGQVVRTRLQATDLVEMAVGIFDRPIYPSELASKGTPADDDYWDWDNWPADSGLVQAFGAGDDLAGYWPLAAADEDASITGMLDNDQSWSYTSQQPPWLWVALWATSATTIAGELHPGPQGAS